MIVLSWGERRSKLFNHLILTFFMANNWEIFVLLSSLMVSWIISWIASNISIGALLIRTTRICTIPLELHCEMSYITITHTSLTPTIACVWIIASTTTLALASSKASVFAFGSVLTCVSFAFLAIVIKSLLIFSYPS